MNNQIAITSGKKYLDIDAYAGILAYKKLLCALGYDALALSTAPTNESVSKAILDLNFKFDDIKDLKEDAKYIVLDVSNPEFFDTFVKENSIIEIIDHHVGYESYWQNKNVKSQIEFIGSVCTIIFEKIVANNKENILDKSLCKILIAGILDNTLNLKSSITTKRDIDAYHKLQTLGQVDDNWSYEYFASCYEKVSKDIGFYLKDDIKIEHTGDILPDVLGQLIVLQKEDVYNNLDKVKETFQKYDNWLLNVIVLNDGQSHLIYSSDAIKENLGVLFKGKDTGRSLVLEKCLLRKEIIKIARDYDIASK